MINDLRQRLLDRYLRIGLEGDSRVPGHLIIRSEQLEKAHPGKVVDLSNCLSYLRTLLLPITTGNTEIQKE
jgi:hypothetical protein